MMVMDARVVKQDARGALKVMTPKLQRALVDFATMRPDSEPPAPPARAPAERRELTLVDEPRARHRRRLRARLPPPPRSRPLAGSTASRLSRAHAGAPHCSAGDLRRRHLRPRPPAARACDRRQRRRREPRPNTRQQAAISPEIDRLHAALRRSPIALHVQRLVPLTKGSQLKRYEVLLRSKSETAPNAAPARHVEGRRGERAGLDDRPPRGHRAHWLSGAPSGRLENHRGHVFRESHHHRAARRALHQIRRIVPGEIRRCRRE